MSEKTRYIITAAALAAVIAAVFIIGINIGAMDISIGDIISVVKSELFGFEKTVPDNVSAVVWKIRIPRIICSMFVGAGLAVSGAVFQAILINPLADPYTLGISNGASFGAALAIIINITYEIYIPVSAMAFSFSILTLIAVIAISKRGNSFESSNIIIGGIIISAVLSSGVSFIKMLAGENVSAVVFWIMGSISSKSWNDVFLIAPVVSLCTLICAVMAKRLDIMTLGDENAYSLGINADRLRLIYLILAAAMTSVCVSVCGVIGFIGLIVPHLLRYWVTAKNAVLIPMSALFGAALLSLADNITRIFSSEIPVGVLTTLIGGPFFIFVFTRGTKIYE